MIRIIPSTPPSAFAFHRSNRSTYRELGGEEAIRKALFEEQGGLCAYCERRLSLDAGVSHSTRIEHFHPQSPAPDPLSETGACEMASGASPLSDSDTTWTNLLLCCNGEEGRGAEFVHCDVTKGNTDICSKFRNPKTFAGSRLLEVHPDGRVVPLTGLPPAAGEVVDEILKLNQKSLKTIRARLYQALMREIAAEKRRAPFGLTQARRLQLRQKLQIGALEGHPSVALSVADKV